MKLSYVALTLTALALLGAGCSGTGSTTVSEGTKTTGAKNLSMIKQEPETMNPAKNLTDPTLEILANLELSPTLSTFVRALKDDEIAWRLTGEGSPNTYTVFAATNQAFDKFGAEYLEKKLFDAQNHFGLNTVITHHIVKGSYRLEDLTDGTTLETLGGKKLTFQKVGDAVKVVSGSSSAYIELYDGESKNGIIHVINNVLLHENSDKFLPE